MHIHALTVDRGGCFHYRIRQPLTELRKRGHWTSWGSGVDFETWDRATVIVQQLLNFPQTADDWVRWCEAGDKLCVAEFDDDVTAVHRSPHHGSAYDDPETVPRMRRMVEAAHLVTVTTEALAAVYRPWNPHVVVLPNAVPDWLTTTPPAPENGRRLVLGYTGSASHLDDYQEWSAQVLGRWMAHRGDATVLRYYGLASRPLGMPLSWVSDVRPWQKQTDAYLASLRMDVGMAPLLDTPFNAGKSPIKALEYAAIGVPAVVTDHPVYRPVVEPGITGFLCRTPGEWIRALSQLWDDPSLRHRMGTAARERARALHTQSRGIVEWERAYREAGERIGVDVG